MYCRRCGARLQQGMVICPECGARQRMQANTVRCANCHGRASTELTVCPHCGRNMRPAGPRWGLWLAALLVVAISGLWGLGKLPVNKVRDTVVSARTNAKSLVQILDAAAGSVAVPVADQNSVESSGVEIVADLPDTPTPTPTVTPTLTPTSTELAVTEAMTQTTPALTDATQTVTATLTVDATTPPDDATTYTVQAGDSLLSIGDRLGIPWTQIADLNSLNGNSVLKIGQKLRLPGPTATPTITPTATPTSKVSATPSPTATPTAAASLTPTRQPGRGTVAPTAAPTTAPTATLTATAAPKGSVTTYVIRSGDTLSKIGAQFGIPWQDIAAANGINASTRLNVGQSLIIPLAGPLPTPTRRPSATPAPSPQTEATPLPAPALRDPGDLTPYQGELATIVLSWSPVIGIPQGALYQVTIRYKQNGESQELSDIRTPLTEVQAPPWLFSRADQPDRKYTWSVQVVQPATDGKGGTVYTPLSPPSAARTFTWN